jgi:hypothetical protein
MTMEAVAAGAGGVEEEAAHAVVCAGKVLRGEFRLEVCHAFLDVFRAAAGGAQDAVHLGLKLGVRQAAELADVEGCEGGGGDVFFSLFLSLFFRMSFAKKSIFFS